MALKKLKNSKFLRFIIKEFIVPPVFYGVRLFKDQMFLTDLRNQSLRPSIFFYPISFLVRGGAFLTRLFAKEFNDFAFSKYANYIRHHYSREGRGYFSYENLTDGEKIKLYGQPHGRIQYFIDHYSDLLNYQNGDSFFDAGCGRGQNIKVLLEAYDQSRIQGVDLSKEAVEVINLAVSRETLHVSPGDLTSPDTFRSISDGAFDHVIMSHVFSLIIDKGVNSTKALRASIIKELVRIANKSVLILDGYNVVATEEAFVIEQAFRGSFAETILPYFPQNRGMTITLQGEAGVGVLFMKTSQGEKP